LAQILTSTTNLFLSRRFLIGGSLAAAGASVLSACTTTAVLAPADQSTIGDVSAEALPLVNAIRARRKLPALKVAPSVISAAQDQAVRMSRYGKMSHFLGSDKSFFARMKRQDVPMPAAENIAAGQQTVEAAVSAWEHSPHHLENMLGRYDSIGVVVARNVGTGNIPYWAMVLCRTGGQPTPPGIPSMFL
jgi:uncharacterized protein YkwD